LLARRRTLSVLATAGIVVSATWVVSVLGVRPAPREIRSLPGFQGVRVHDDASVLGSFGPLLEGLATQWWDELGIDVLIVTGRAPATPIDAWADRIFLEHRVGLRLHAPMGGLLIVLDAEGRRAGLHVSRSLADAFPDSIARSVASDLAPHAGYGAVGMAALDALHRMKDHVFARIAAGKLRAPVEVLQADAFKRGLAYLGTGKDRADFALLGADGDFKQRIEEPQRGRYAPATNPLESAERYLLVLGELAGDPTLPLFTPGSQVQLERYAVAPFEYRKRRQATLASRPLLAVVAGDLAVVLSEKPVRGFAPILLRRIDGVWRIDLVETWKNLFFTDGGRYVVANLDNPYMFGLRSLPGRGSYALDPLDLGARSPQEAVAELEAQLARRDDPATHFRLAEILFRNCFAAVDALSHYEAAARGAGHVDTYVWTMAERASYLGLYRQAIPFYEVLGSGAYERLGDAYYALAEYDDAATYYERALEHGGDKERIAQRVEKARFRHEEASAADDDAIW
jgi:tetratricopeptide (TPR) repeat protein